MNPFRDIRAAALVIVLAVAAAYANSFTGPFQLDDLGSIRDNPTIRSLGDVGQVLSRRARAE